jgi:hypothetical protein
VADSNVRTYLTGGGNQYWKAKVSERSPRISPFSLSLKNRRYTHATKNPNWIRMYGDGPKTMTRTFEIRR